MLEYLGVGKTANSSITGSLHLLKWQAYTALFVIIFTGCATFILLKFISIFVPLRMSEADMEEGDIAVHGHEVYPSDIPSLGVAGGTPGRIRAPDAGPTSAPPGGGGA
jgi:Amt family ammonium transporter